MKIAFFLKTVFIFQLALVLAQNVEAQETSTLPLESFTLFDDLAGQGNGVQGNNQDLFDGSIFMESNLGVFATPLYLRERESQAQPQLEVRADLNFDLSGIESVTGATLEFTAYTLNNVSDFTVGRIVDGGTEFERKLADAINVTSTFGAPRAVANYSIDVTAIVNTWTSDPASNLGFRIQLNEDINDGVGFFEGTATEINDGSFGSLPIPEDYLPMQLVLEGVEGVGGFDLGDVDMNGVVDFFDIQPFIDVLSNKMFQDEADINGDGTVDFFDIQPFIDILSAG